MINFQNDFANGTRIDGNLGIGGTPMADARLHVAGNVRVMSPPNVAPFEPALTVDQQNGGVGLWAQVYYQPAMPAVMGLYAPDLPGALYTVEDCAAIFGLSNAPQFPEGVAGVAFDTDASNMLTGSGVQGDYRHADGYTFNRGELGTPSYAVIGQQFGTAGPGVGAAVYGVSTLQNGIGVLGYVNWGSNAHAIHGISSDGFAGFFEGNAHVTGTLTASAKSFKIDHPLDPENKSLSHASVESSEMKTLYDGVVVTDARGYATVGLPAWFEALNGDFRYQLTVVDDADIEDWVLAKVSKEIADNRFTIRTSAPETKVCWQVSGVRRDAWAVAHPLVVEQEKTQAERGISLTPPERGRPKGTAIDVAGKPAPTTTS